jgi:hypothetical protein
LKDVSILVLTDLAYELVGKRSFCPKATFTVKSRIWRENYHTFI